MSTNGTNDTTLSRSVGVRLTPAEFSRLERLAHRVRGLKPSALARSLLEVALAEAERDPARWLLAGGDQGATVA